MRVLHLGTEAGWRGGEQQTLYLLRGLRARGVDQVLVARRGEELARRAAAEDLAVRPLGLRGPGDPRALAGLVALVRRRPFDVIHMHDARSHGLGVLAARLGGGRRGPRTVVSRRVDFSIHRHGFLGLNRWKYVAADRILCVSAAVRDVLVADGVPASRLAVVHDGIDPVRLEDPPDRDGALRAEFDIPPGAPVVGNVAACVDHKGQRYLVEAAPAILRSRPETRILVVGDGELRGALVDLAARLGVADRVLFPGFRRDVPALLHLFDLFCFPSHLEGLGSSVLDAMAAGTPVVATRAGGIPEIVRDGVDGVLVEPRDPAALAEALLGLLDRPEEALRLAASARRRVRDAFHVDRMVEATLGQYEGLLAGRARR